MNLYERYLAMPTAASTYYAEWARNHDNCPDCCPGGEDNRTPGVPCPRCWGTGVIRTDIEQLPPLLQLVQSEETTNGEPSGSAAMGSPAVVHGPELLDTWETP